MALANQNDPPALFAQSPSPLLLAGPTAVGKSDIALALALRVGGEIVSVDSMQVYRGLDIGTAKPSGAERERVPHHLIDVAELSEAFDVARYVLLARRAVAEIQSRGRTPILCGGTGLYFSALCGGLGEAPPADPGLRAQLECCPLPELLDELAARDPVTFARIDRHNPRRVVRAVEVIRLTGRPFSTQRADWTGGGSSKTSSLIAFGVSRGSADLGRRIVARVDQMFNRGLVSETQRLLAAGLASNRTACQALGYRQVIEYLQGHRSLEATVDLVKIRTRQFSKRQMTWFRRQLRLDWVPLEPESRPQTVAESIARTYAELAAQAP